MQNTMENNMSIKDELDAYKEGYADGKQFVLDFVNQTTKQDFKELVDLIIWIRKQESQNEVK